MATETKEKEDKKPETPKDNWPEADKKVVSINAQLDAAKGKDDNNPYTWMNKNKWDSIVEGIKARKPEALAALNAIPATIDTTVTNTGPIVLEESQFKPKQ